MAEKYFYGWFDNKWSNPLNWSSEWISSAGTVANASLPTSSDSVYFANNYSSASPTGYWANEIQLDLNEIVIDTIYAPNLSYPGPHNDNLFHISAGNCIFKCNEYYLGYNNKIFMHGDTSTFILGPEYTSAMVYDIIIGSQGNYNNLICRNAYDISIGNNINATTYMPLQSSGPLKIKKMILMGEHYEMSFDHWDTTNLGLLDVEEFDATSAVAFIPDKIAFIQKPGYIAKFHNCFNYDEQCLTQVLYASADNQIIDVPTPSFAYNVRTDYVLSNYDVSGNLHTGITFRFPTSGIYGGYNVMNIQSQINGVVGNGGRVIANNCTLDFATNDSDVQFGSLVVSGCILNLPNKDMKFDTGFIFDATTVINSQANTRMYLNKTVHHYNPDTRLNIQFVVLAYSGVPSIYVNGTGKESMNIVCSGCNSFSAINVGSRTVSSNIRVVTTNQLMISGFQGDISLDLTSNLNATNALILNSNENNHAINSIRLNSLTQVTLNKLIFYAPTIDFSSCANPVICTNCVKDYKATVLNGNWQLNGINNGETFWTNAANDNSFWNSSNWSAGHPVSASKVAVFTNAVTSADCTVGSEGPSIFAFPGFYTSGVFSGSFRVNPADFNCIVTHVCMLSGMTKFYSQYSYSDSFATPTLIFSGNHIQFYPTDPSINAPLLPQAEFYSPVTIWKDIIFNNFVSNPNVIRQFNRAIIYNDVYGPGKLHVGGPIFPTAPTNVFLSLRENSNSIGRVWCKLRSIGDGRIELNVLTGHQFKPRRINGPLSFVVLNQVSSMIGLEIDFKTNASDGIDGEKLGIPGVDIYHNFCYGDIAVKFSNSWPNLYPSILSLQKNPSGGGNQNAYVDLTNHTKFGYLGTYQGSVADNFMVFPSSDFYSWFPMGTAKNLHVNTRCFVTNDYVIDYNFKNGSGYFNMGNNYYRFDYSNYKTNMPIIVSGSNKLIPFVMAANFSAPSFSAIDCFITKTWPYFANGWLATLSASNNIYLKNVRRLTSDNVSAVEPIVFYENDAQTMETGSLRMSAKNIYFENSDIVSHGLFAEVYANVSPSAINCNLYGSNAKNAQGFARITPDIGHTINWFFYNNELLSVVPDEGTSWYRTAVLSGSGLDTANIYFNGNLVTDFLTRTFTSALLNVPLLPHGTYEFTLG